MATKLIVEVCEIEDVKEHPNASALALAQIKGWQVVIPLVEDPQGTIRRKFVLGVRDDKGRRIPWSQPDSDNLPMSPFEEVRFSPAHNKGDKVVYFPTDTLLPKEWLDQFGATPYCTFYNNRYEGMGKIRCAKLRGEPSFGLVVNVPDPSWEIGKDVSEYYGAQKYELPVKFLTGDMEAEHPCFIKYTDIENLRNFPNVLDTDEIVSVTEKIHGTNCRIGFGAEPIPNSDPMLVLVIPMAGSHEHRRKDPGEDKRQTNLYWYPWTLTSVQKMMRCFVDQGIKSVVLYGEVYGNKVQGKFTYDTTSEIPYGFRAFDLMIEGKYLDYDVFREWCDRFDVPVVPLLYRGKMDMDVIKQEAKGMSTCGKHIREGVVVKPVVERVNPKIGRVILKYIGDEYLLLKEGGKIDDSKDA